jgi:polyisoprenoid-binding protein YceI
MTSGFEITRNGILTFFVPAMLAMAVRTPPSQRPYAEPRSASTLWIQGGSNVHDWTCRTQTFEAHIDVDTAHDDSAEPSLGAQHVKRVSVKVPVRNLSCGNGRMERDLYHALKADDPATPSYIIGVFDALRAPEAGVSYIDTEGTITVAGVEKGTRFRITMERRADGTVAAHGRVPLLMTDFGVTPPTGLFGLIRSKNQIVVKFEIVMARGDDLSLAIR